MVAEACATLVAEVRSCLVPSLEGTAFRSGHGGHLPLILGPRRHGS